VSKDPNLDGRSDRLASLDRRIAAARGAPEPKPGAGKDKYAAASVAWQMVFELVAGMAVGATMGWGLDWAFGTKPLFLIVFILLGFAAGVRMMMRSAARVQRQRAADAADD